jgi:hypothetical protein
MLQQLSSGCPLLLQRASRLAAAPEPTAALPHVKPHPLLVLLQLLLHVDAASLNELRLLTHPFWRMMLSSGDSTPVSQVAGE